MNWSRSQITRFASLLRRFFWKRNNLLTAENNQGKENKLPKQTELLCTDRTVRATTAASINGIMFQVSTDRPTVQLRQLRVRSKTTKNWRQTSCMRCSIRRMSPWIFQSSTNHHHISLRLGTYNYKTQPSRSTSYSESRPRLRKLFLGPCLLPIFRTQRSFLLLESIYLFDYVIEQTNKNHA